MAVAPTRIADLSEKTSDQEMVHQTGCSVYHNSTAPAKRGGRSAGFRRLHVDGRGPDNRMEKGDGGFWGTASQCLPPKMP